MVYAVFYDGIAMRNEIEYSYHNTAQKIHCTVRTNLLPQAKTFVNLLTLQNLKVQLSLS